MGLNSILKELINRPRPDTAYAHMFQSGSFPSSHAFGVTVIGVLLSYLALKYFSAQQGRVTTAALLVLALGVGISRLYLGAHYPTDVLAGWLLGGLSALFIIKYFKP